MNRESDPYTIADILLKKKIKLENEKK